MRRAQRLRDRKDFAAVYRRGRRYGGKELVLRALATGGRESRFGFVASGKLGKAVARNRLRRRLREAVRSLPVASGWDIVLSGREGGARLDYQRLREEVADLMARAGVLEWEGASK